MVVCPYCGETNEVGVDPGGGNSQEYVEDCQVCCQPWRVVVQYVDGQADITAAPLDE
ncbi:MAG: CPXCG motif-containing cysteine-rich protein [Gemmatimonadaceae bacterium]